MTQNLLASGDLQGTACIRTLLCRLVSAAYSQQGHVLRPGLLTLAGYMLDTPGTSAAVDPTADQPSSRNFVGVKGLSPQLQS